MKGFRRRYLTEPEQEEKDTPLLLVEPPQTFYQR